MPGLKHVKNALVLPPNWVGDAVMAVPALEQLRRIMDGTRITLATRPNVAGVFEGQGLSDEIYVTAGAGLGNFIQDAGRLRKRSGYDLAVLFPNSFASALFARTAGAKLVAGYPTDWRRPLLRPVVRFLPGYGNSHQVVYYLRIVAQLEELRCGTQHVVLEETAPRLKVTAEEIACAGDLFNTLSIRRDSPGEKAQLLALCPGATNSRAKQWLPERFAAVADLLWERRGFETIIIGTNMDREIALRVASLMTSPVTVLAGRTSISELKGILFHTSLMISNDTGAAHVSSALGVPTVVVFGPTEQFATRPVSDVTEIIRHPVGCSPCMLKDCPIDHRCMTGVRVEDVYGAALRVLGAERKSRQAGGTIGAQQGHCKPAL